MIKKIFTFIIIFASISTPQDVYNYLLNSEKEKYFRTSKISGVNYPGDTKIDVLYYGLKLKVSANPNYLSGSVLIKMKVDTTEINTCFLDLKNGLIVDSVLLNGNRTTYTHLNHKVNIDLDRVYLYNEKYAVDVFYRGIPNPTGFGSFEFDTHNGFPIIWTLSEPYGAPDWFPCKDTPADKADSSEVWITVADNLSAVSNGTLESVTNNGNGTKTFHWKNQYTIAHYLISLAITNYYQYDTYFKYTESDSMVITHFVYQENFNAVKNILDETDDMIEVFSNRYSMYPFLSQKYGHAQTNQSGAMEHQTCTSLGLSAFNPRTVSHELAHQWYGDMITCKDWHHVWLNEGFATYSAAVYIEAKEGKAAYDTYIISEMELARAAQGTIWVEDITDINEIFNWNRSYKKAGCVLHMLRGITGDSTFFDIMRAYADDPNLKWGVAVTEDFQDVAENVYGQDLDYFFQEWIYGENYPKYTLGWNKSQISGDIYHINLNIYQTVNTDPPYFTMPVQIKFDTSLGDTIVTLFNNAQNQNFQFNIFGEPSSIVFDPGNWILKTLLGITEVRYEIFQVDYNLEQNYPNPFNPTTTIKYSIPEMSKVSLILFNLLGEEVTTLVNEEKVAGTYELTWYAENLPSGVYFYQLRAGDFISTRKMILMK